MSPPRKYDLRALQAEGQKLAGRSGPGEKGAPRSDGPPPTSHPDRLIGADDDPGAAPSAAQRGRATTTLQATWIDPEETPFVPAPRPGKAVPARLFSLLVLAGILGLLAWLIVPEVSLRVADVQAVTVRNGVLTAQPVPLAPTRAATVQELFVDAGDLPDEVLPAGTPIARLSSSATEDGRPVTVNLSVPFDARFVSVDTLEGAVTLPGTPVATVYDPQKMYVIITVRPTTLDTLRRGMRARLSSSVLDEKVGGTVISAVPLLGTDQEPSSAELVHVRIQPDEDRLKDLVPGIRFDARIDLDSAPDGARPLVFTDATDGG